MPAIIISSAPGIARAVARPPEGATSGSAVPWMTSVGAVMRAQLGGAVARGDDRGELTPGPCGVVVAVVAGVGERADVLGVARQAGEPIAREQALHVRDEAPRAAGRAAQEDRVDAQRGLAAAAGCRCWT